MYHPKSMDEKWLRELLCKKEESEWYDFKLKLELYDAQEKLIEIKRDELVKDILGFANGNTFVIRKNKFLIIGADDKQYDDTGMRFRQTVDYKFPNASEISLWVNNACTPAIVGLECQNFLIDGKILKVITIPPTFELHETIRDLKANGKFNVHTVFMRSGTSTILASVRDGIAIRDLKMVYRRETNTPSSIYTGGIVGAFISFVLLRGVARNGIVAFPYDAKVVLGIVVSACAFLGAEIGWIYNILHETQYHFRFMSLFEKIAIFLLVVLMIVILTWSFTQ